MIAVIIYAAAGAVLGWNIPNISEKFAAMKRKEQVLSLPATGSFSGIAVRGTLALINSAVWALLAASENSQISLVLSLIFTSAVVISITDLCSRIIPNELVIFLVILGIRLQFFYFGIGGIIFSILSMVATVVLFITAAGAAGFEKVGAGDVKLAGSMALAVGFPNFITALIVMGLSITLFCLTGLLTRRLTKKSMFPFAPFIMLGMASSLLLIVLD